MFIVLISENKNDPNIGNAMEENFVLFENIEIDNELYKNTLKNKHR
jgi:hypothetical protein